MTIDITDVAVDCSPAGAPGPAWDGHGAVRFAEGHLRAGDLEVHTESHDLGSGRRIDLAVRNPGRRAVSLSAVRMRLSVVPSRVLEHGYQSWSPVEVRQVSDPRPLRHLSPGWARGIWHAAPWLAGRAVMGDQFLVLGPGRRSGPGGAVGFLDAKQHLSTVVAERDSTWVAAWLDGLALGPGEQLRLDPLWISAGPPGERYSEMAAHWGEVAGARTSARSLLGWCSWYQYFSKVTPGALRSNLPLAADHRVEVLQVDDGYQREVGDWLLPSRRWARSEQPSSDPRRPTELEALVSEIGDAGLRPGIWTAPFIASPRSHLLGANPDWAARDRGGGPLKAMWNPLAWSGWAYALDTTNPAVLDHLRTTFSRLKELGFDYHKIDFCYSAAMIGRRLREGSQTRAQSLRAGLAAVREGIGESSLLLGCGCPLGPAVGIVDAMRVSPDTAARWGPGAVQVPGYRDTAPAASNALRASVLRAPLHRRLWVNDPDCLPLRPRGTRLSAYERQLLATAVEGLGGFTMLSDDLATYGQAQWALVEHLRAALPEADRTLDLVDPFAPEPQVRGGARTLSVSWSGPRPYAHLEGRPVG